MVFRPGLVILLVSVLVLKVSMASEHCVMYGTCGENDFGAESTCVYNGTAKPLGVEEALNILKEICPELSKEQNLCCSADQLVNLRNNMKIIETLGLGRCPSCIVNFRKNFCQFVCSPKQSTFLEITEIGESDDGEEIVETINYHMSYKYAEGMFASCKDVQGQTPGSTLLDLMCGGWGRDCTPKRWLNFMGATADDGGFSPFQINYLLTSEKTIVGENGDIFHPMEESTTVCSESPGPNLEVCTCVDCEAACQLTTAQPPPLPEEQESPGPSLPEEQESPGPSLPEEQESRGPPLDCLHNHGSMAALDLIVFCVFTLILMAVFPLH